MQHTTINASGRVSESIHCDASGCDMFATYYGELGHVDFGWPKITTNVNGVITEKDYCMSCYLRSEGFGI